MLAKKLREWRKSDPVEVRCVGNPKFVLSLCFYLAVTFSSVFSIDSATY
jgi:hypothetical protein